MCTYTRGEQKLLFDYLLNDYLQINRVRVCVCVRVCVLASDMIVIMIICVLARARAPSISIIYARTHTMGPKSPRDRGAPVRRSRSRIKTKYGC